MFLNCSVQTAVEDVSEDTDIDQTLEVDSESSSSDTDTETEDLIDTIKRNDVLRGINTQESVESNLQSLRTLQRKVSSLSKRSPNMVNSTHLSKVDLDSADEGQGRYTGSEEEKEAHANNEDQDLNNNHNNSQVNSGASHSTISNSGASSTSQPVQLDSNQAKTGPNSQQGIKFEDEEECWGDNSVSDESAPLYPKATLRFESDHDQETDSSQHKPKMVKSPIKKGKH